MDQLDPVAWVLPGEINAMKNCVRYSRGLTTTSGEVNVRFVSLLSPFDRTTARKAPFVEEKSV